MYNRYIPETVDYEPLSGATTQPVGGQRTPFSLKDVLSTRGDLPWKELWSREENPLTSLLQSLKLEGIDSGDILLVLLILFLLIEGDDQWELIITLGLLLIMGLADGSD